MHAKEWIENILAHPNWGIVAIEWDAVDEIKSILDLYTKDEVEENE